MIRLITVGLLLITATLGAQEKSPVEVTTFTYKTVGDLEIKLDVHRPADMTRAFKSSLISHNHRSV